MKIVSLRKPPFLGSLVLGLIFGALCTYALETGKFPLPPKGHPLWPPYIFRSSDPLLFLFWVRLSGAYFAGMCGIAVFRLDPIEERFSASLSRIGAQRVERGVSDPFRSRRIERFLTFFALAVFCVCYVATLT